MAIFGKHIGAWGTPDFGVTEWVSDKLGKGRTSSGGSNLIGASRQASYTPSATQLYDSPAGPQPAPSGQVLGSTTGGQRSSGSGQANSGQSLDFSSGLTRPDQSAGGDGPSEMDVINSEFNSFQSFLNDQESQANKNFSNTESQITADRDNAITSSEAERSQRITGLNEDARQGRDQERLDLARVRQLLADLEQKNNARLAISGGGSAADAMSDRFARTAQQTSGQVISEGRSYQNQITQQVQRANDFYDQKKTEIQTAATSAINQARAKLQENLSAIAAERRASADAKARARIAAWQDYNSKVNTARLQAAQFQAQYDMWKRQVDAELGAASQFAVDTPTMDNSQALGYAMQANQGIGAVQPVSNQTSYAPTRVNLNKGVGDDEEQNQFALA